MGIVRWYSSDSNLAPHIDDTKLFGPIIIGISLYATDHLRFTHKKVKNKPPVNITIHPRSVYFLTKESRYDWKHEARSLKNTRISITLRSVLSSPPLSNPTRHTRSSSLSFQILPFSVVYNSMTSDCKTSFIVKKDLYPAPTEGEGDCAFHAIFGSWNPVNKIFYCDKVKKLREIFSLKISAITCNSLNTQDIRLKPYILTGIRELLFSNYNQNDSIGTLNKEFRNSTKKIIFRQVKSGLTLSKNVKEIRNFPNGSIL